MLRIVAGSPTITSRAAAEQSLLAHPEMPSGAEYTIEQVHGLWVAAIHIAEEETDETEVQPEPGAEAESEAPSEEKTAAQDPADALLDGPTPGEATPEPSIPEDGPSSDDKGSESIKKELAELTKLVKSITDALGLGEKKDSLDEEEIPKHEPPVPPKGPEETGVTDGRGGPIPKQKVVPQNALLKPGQSPQAFASVSEDHPWHEVITSGAEEFEVQEEIGSLKTASIAEELVELARGTGYRLASIKDSEIDGTRVAIATIALDDNE